MAVRVATTITRIGVCLSTGQLTRIAHDTRCMRVLHDRCIAAAGVAVVHVKGVDHTTYVRSYAQSHTHQRVGVTTFSIRPTVGSLEVYVSDYMLSGGLYCCTTVWYTALLAPSASY